MPCRWQCGAALIHRAFRVSVTASVGQGDSRHKKGVIFKVLTICSRVVGSVSDCLKVVDMMRLGDDVGAALHLGQVDDVELRALVESHCGGGVFHAGDTQEVLYGARREEDFALKFVHDNNDRIRAIELGPGLKPSELEILGRRVENELIATAGTLVGREILLSEKQVIGFFGYAGRFQILPAPSGAPRPGPYPGLSARHPFVVEALFAASSNPTINRLRRSRILDELELVLNALLEGSICSGRIGPYLWATPGPDSLQKTGSVFLRKGYSWPGLAIESESFSKTEGLDGIHEVLPVDYYAHETWSPTSTLAVPSNLTELLARFDALKTIKRFMWLRACYWFRHSRVVQHTSFSAAFMALVTAIEALMPRDARGNNKKFESFVDGLELKHATSTSRRSFYRMRSEVAHGAHLLYEDRQPSFVGITPEMTQSWQRFGEMRVIARNVLVNWLMVIK